MVLQGNMGKKILLIWLQKCSSLAYEKNPLLFCFFSFWGVRSCLKHSQAKRQLCPGTNIALVWARVPRMKIPPAQAAQRDCPSAEPGAAPSPEPSLCPGLFLTENPTLAAQPLFISCWTSQIFSCGKAILPRGASLEGFSFWLSSAGRNPSCFILDFPPGCCSLGTQGMLAGSYEQGKISSSEWKRWEPGRSLCLLCGYLGISRFWGDALVKL